MRDGNPCPKCGGRNIVRCRAFAKGSYDSIPAGFSRQADMYRWICCDCGYCELWADREQLENIKRTWSVES